MTVPFSKEKFFSRYQESLEKILALEGHIFIHSCTQLALHTQTLGNTSLTFLSILLRNRDKQVHKESDAGKHNWISERMIK